MKKKYKITPTKKQLEIMSKYWAIFQEHQNIFYKSMFSLEKDMERLTKIKGIEFIKDDMCGGDFIGIGDVNRNMSLIQAETLEK